MFMNNITNYNTTTPYPQVDGCVCDPSTEDGMPYNRLIAHIFRDCVYIERDYIGFFIGLSSLLFWIFAQGPQFVTNCKNNSASALSVWFLAQWMFGDSVNLISTFLTNQISTVKITSILFVSMDVCLLLQYLCLEGCCCCARKKKRKRKKKLRILTNDNHGETKDPLLRVRIDGNGNYGSTDMNNNTRRTSTSALYGAFVPVLIFCSIFTILGMSINVPPQHIELYNNNNNNNAMLVQQQRIPSQHYNIRRRQLFFQSSSNNNNNNDINNNNSNEPKTKKISFNVKHFYLFAGRGAPPAHRPPSCTEDDSPQWEKTIGVVFGWVSTVIYLFSRIPQILKNIKRGSVEGLSPIMFFCAVMGNLTYAGGILIRARNEAAVIKALPYLVGSIGTLCFDFTILLQFLYYKDKIPRRPKRLSKKFDENGNVIEDENNNYDDYINIEDDDEEEEDDEPTRGLHNIVSWEASPWLSPEQIKNLRRQSHEKLNASMNGGRNNTGYTPQNMKKKSTTPRT